MRPREQSDGGRGREARTPREIPRRGWLDILRRTKDEISSDNLALVAAGVAFYSLLAIPPALAAGIALWGLVADPQTLQTQLDQLAGVLPEDAYQVFHEQLRTVASRSATALGWTAALGFLVSLWSARAAVGAMIGALNIVYEERERRGFFRLAFTALLLTLGALAGGLIALLLVAGVPAALSLLGVGSVAEVIVQIVRWALLIALVTAGLALLYRLAPSRHDPRWEWVTSGAVIATMLWIAASAGFSFFVANFGRYGETWGALAGVVVLLMWLWISAFVALVGAEINAEMELQTRRDTTTGPEKPLGRREAWAADHVAGESDDARRRGEKRREPHISI